MPITSVPRPATNRAQPDESATLADANGPWTVGRVLPVGLAIGVLFGVITVLLG
jgi:hypothetical protein